MIGHKGRGIPYSSSSIRATLFVLVLSLSALYSPVLATEPPLEFADGSLDETSRLWFVELSGAPLAEVNGAMSVSQQVSYLDQLEAEKNSFRWTAKNAGISFKERFSFSALWNGLSIEMDPNQLTTLTRISIVKNLYPIVTFSIPETQGLDENPDLGTALAMTGADVAQSELGLSGAGVKVAVMDTGVDYNHPDLGGCFGPGCRVAFGFDLVGNAFNADPTSPSFNPIPSPDPDPDDCNGHGTHVAGIVGANGAVKGVAPGVTFGAYRVFGCEGSTTADIMIAAMEMILADEMDVLNMSIGAALQWPQYPTAQAATRLVNRGVSVVASIGNNGLGQGACCLYAAGAPGVGSKVIGVASFDNTHVTLATFTISPDNMAIGYGAASGAPAPPTSGTFPMKRTGTPASTADACSALPSGSLTGHVALIRRGTCTFRAKTLNAFAAGAIGVVLYNSVAGRFSPTVAGTPAITIPVVAITAADGVLINNRLALGPVDLTWTALLGSFVNPTGGLISSFSSFGLAADLSVKPDIGAPGGLIRSTLPLEQGGYGTISGTSMSAPHVAGGVALLLEARPNTPSQAVRSILQNSADPKPWFGDPGAGLLDNVHRQGAGMLDIDDAILATTKIEPGKLALGESQAGPFTGPLAVENNGNAAVTYDLSHAPALSTLGITYPPGAPSFTTGFGQVDYSLSGVPVTSLTVPAGATVSLDVMITANAGLADKSIYGGYLVLTPQGGGAPLRVPYAGFKGDYQSITALVPTSNGFPWLARLVAPNFVKQLAGATFTFDGANQIPYILVHLEHQVRRLRVEVFDANTGDSFHRAMDFQFVGRNAGAAGFFALAWNGVTTHGNQAQLVPDGQYVLTLSVQKALGDDNNPAHWETWTSPMFNIDRPGSPLASFGDLNIDCVVDILDLAAVAFSYDAVVGDQRYSQAADLNSDGKVNILDVAIPATYYQMRCV